MKRLGALQEYYANTGALKNAAETAQGGKKVGCSIVETFSKSTKPRELEEVLRLEYRSKLLNPKWAQVCVAGVLVSLKKQCHVSTQATCCTCASQLRCLQSGHCAHKAATALTPFAPAPSQCIEMRMHRRQ